jgi:hypothetical protein
MDSASTPEDQHQDFSTRTKIIRKEVDKLLHLPIAILVTLSPLPFPTQWRCEDTSGDGRTGIAYRL